MKYYVPYTLHNLLNNNNGNVIFLKLYDTVVILFIRTCFFFLKKKKYFMEMFQNCTSHEIFKRSMGRRTVIK